MKIPSAALTGYTALALLAGPTHAVKRPPAPRSCHPVSVPGVESAPGEKTLSPYFFVQSGDAALDAMPLKGTTVKAHITGVIADVTVTQTYKNEGKKALEAIYIFPGSTRAAVYGMKMTLGKRTIEAKIREKGQARRDYENAKTEGRSASLLEQQRPNVFQMNVANILPGDDIQVELRYTELLVPEGGTYAFVYPTVVGPRYSNTPVSQATESEQWVANPYTEQGIAPKNTFALEVSLNAGMPIAKMSCKTHKNTLNYEGRDQAVLKLSEEERLGGNRDFILHYRLSDKKIQSGLMLYEGKDENFFLLTVQPPQRVQTRQMPGREFVFIVDVSGSMHGYPLETSKALMRDLVSNLRPQDCFNILVFESGSALWAESSRPATQENLQSALTFVGAKSGGGGTEILSALKRALNLPKTKGFSRTFVIATDGYISVEPQVLDYVRNNLDNANMFAFGIGSAVNRHLIEGIAHAGMGEPFIITKAEEASHQAEKFREYIASPVLTDIQIHCKGFQAYDVEPVKCPDVLAERPVLYFGKWRGEAKGQIDVSGQSGQGRFHQRFDVGQTRPSQAHAALRFLWARHRLQYLSDFDALNPSGERSKAILDLGLKYGLLTSKTSFVAIDSEIRNKNGQCSQVKQPLPLPEGVSNQAVGSPACFSVAPAPSMPMECLRISRRAKGTFHDAACKVEKEFSKEKSLPQPQSVKIVQLSASDKTVALNYLRQRLQARLADPALTAHLQTLPAHSTLILKIDAQGRVLQAHFQQDPGRALSPDQQALVCAMLQWHFGPLYTKSPFMLTIQLNR